MILAVVTEKKKVLSEIYLNENAKEIAIDASHLLDRIKIRICSCLDYNLEDV